MEFVDGRDAARMARAQARAAWREIARDVRRRPAAGSPPRTRAGLVHRDFKPDNVHGRRRRPRRACSTSASRAGGADAAPTRRRRPRRERASATRLTATGAVIGTPAYMAPEQSAARPADARSDQFSFCVALWEALLRPAPVRRPRPPRPLANDPGARRFEPPTRPRPRVPTCGSAVLRGLARDPAGPLARPWTRCSTALARDPGRPAGAGPRRPRRRRLVGGGYGVAAHQPAARRVCSGAADELAGVWDAARRAAVAACRAARPASPTPTAPRPDRRAPRRLRRGLVPRTPRACESHRRGDLSGTRLFDLRMACLRERRAQLAGGLPTSGSPGRREASGRSPFCSARS